MKRAPATDRPPVYSRLPKGSAVEPAIRELSRQTPTMPATGGRAADRLGPRTDHETVAHAMIDRPVHHAEVHSLKGDSYRTRGRGQLLGRVPTTAQETD